MAKVLLLAHTPQPERLVAAAAKLCYSPSGADALLEGLTPQKSREFVDMLSGLGHESPIEHVSFTFAMEGVSRSLLAQLTRHRIASYSVQSQRYVRENAFDYVVPPEIEAIPEAKALFLSAVAQSQEHYAAIAGLLRDKHVDKLIAGGLDEKAARQKAEKMAIEDARFVLPNACGTNLMVTMNARSLLNFFRHRCCNRAQWEIRLVAEEMLRLVRAAAPGLFAGAGPPCLGGSCPEGKMSCGEAALVRARYERPAEGTP